MDQPQDISLSIVRNFKAPPEKVFAALISPDMLKRWMGPSDDMTVPIAEADPKVGGRYRIVMRDAEGKDHKVGGVYREFSPVSKLAFTWAWEDSPEHETLVSIILRKTSAGTEMKLVHTKFATDQSRDRHNQGWTGCIAKLERLLAA